MNGLVSKELITITAEGREAKPPGTYYRKANTRGDTTGLGPWKNKTPINFSTGKSGCPFFFHFLLNGHEAVAQTLLRAGANAGFLSRKKQTALELAQTGKTPNSGVIAALTSPVQGSM